MDKLFLTVFAILQLLFYQSFGQATYFEKYIGTAMPDFCRSVKQDNAGNIYLGGFSRISTSASFDFCLYKCDPSGLLLWQKFYGTSNDEEALGMTATSDNHFVLCGQRWNGVDFDALVVKVDTAGTMIWERTYSTTASESFKKIAPTSDGGFVLAGFITDTWGYNDNYVVKLDSSGFRQWEKIIGGEDNDYADAIIQLADGGYIITTDTRTGTAGGYDIEVMRLDSAGEIIWRKLSGNELENGCQGIFLTSSGGYLSFGETEIYQSSPYDFYLELIDSTGETVWAKTIGVAEKRDAVFDVMEVDDGFIFTGYSNSYNEGPINLPVVKIDKQGELLWARSYGSSGREIGYDITVSRSGGILIAGVTDSPEEQIYLLHLDTLGVISGMPSVTSHSSFVISPNPARACDRIAFNHAVNWIQVWSLDGRMVLNEKRNDLELRDMQSGTYVVRAGGNGILYHSKLVVIE